MLKTHKPFQGIIRKYMLITCSIITIIGVISHLTISKVPITIKAQQPSYDSSEWFMAGANPQRTSHVDSTPTNQTEMPGKLYPEWFIPIEPYIPYGWQLVVGNDSIYVSTARGLYAIDRDAGNTSRFSNPTDVNQPWLKWVFPTELPLGQSPTVIGDTIYVGGLDKKTYAIRDNDIRDLTNDPTNPGNSNHQDYTVVWTFDARKYWNDTEPQAEHIAAGFNNNPLVIDGNVFLGNRDGYMYALDQSDGTLLWHFKTDGPILFSAAANTDPNNRIIYFASNDSYAYAVKANTANTNGEQVWKSAKLPGSGFFTWWPVYHSHPTLGDRVIFVGSHNYRGGFINSGAGNNPDIFLDIYSYLGIATDGTLLGPLGTEPGDWIAGAQTMDVSSIRSCLQDPAKQHLNTYHVLDPQTGQEQEIAPILYSGANNNSGTRYPPIVGEDNVLYQTNNYKYQQYIPRLRLMGWKIGTPFMRVTSYEGAVDEPDAFSSGGTMVYWQHHSDFSAGSLNIGASGGSWNYYTLDAMQQYDESQPDPIRFKYYVPNYNQMYITGPEDDTHDKFESYGGINGIYNKHGNQNPFVPYKGKLYIQRGNSIMAFSTNANKIELGKAPTVKQSEQPTFYQSDSIQKELISQVQKIIGPCRANKDWASCHLKTAYQTSGIVDPPINGQDRLNDYWHNTTDTIEILIRTLPYLPETAQDPMQTDVKGYLQYEMTQFPPYLYNHNGWQAGAWREQFDVPPDVVATLLSDSNNAPQSQIYGGFPWHRNPMAFYGMWKYVQTLNLSPTEALNLLNTAKAQSPLMSGFNTLPSSAVFVEKPFVHNAYLAGYLGYIKLSQMADQQGLQADIQAKESILHTLFQQRVALYSSDTPYDNTVTDNQIKRLRVLNASRNFIYLMPDVLLYLKQYDANLYNQFVAKVQQTVDQYDYLASFWFVSRFDDTYDEGAIHVLYDYHTLFQARALFLGKSYDELIKYLDVPAVPRGDLFYIDNLVALLEAPSATPTLQGDLNNDNTVNIQDIIILINEIFTPSGVQGSDINSDGKVDILDVISLINLIFN